LYSAHPAGGKTAKVYDYIVMSVFAVAELNTRGIHIGERHARENKEKKNSGKKNAIIFQIEWVLLVAFLRK
jgi:hypothetical protein